MGCSATVCSTPPLRTAKSPHPLIEVLSADLDDLPNAQAAERGDEQDIAGALVGAAVEDPLDLRLQEGTGLPAGLLDPVQRRRPGRRRAGRWPSSRRSRSDSTSAPTSSCQRPAEGWSGRVHGRETPRFPTRDWTDPTARSPRTLPGGRSAYCFFWETDHTLVRYRSRPDHVIFKTLGSHSAQELIMPTDSGCGETAARPCRSGPR